MELEEGMAGWVRAFYSIKNQIEMYPRIFMTRRMDMRARATLNTMIQHLAHTPDTPQFPTLSGTWSNPHVYVLMHRYAHVQVLALALRACLYGDAIRVQSATTDKTRAVHTYGKTLVTTHKTLLLAIVVAIVVIRYWPLR